MTGGEGATVAAVLDQLRGRGALDDAQLTKGREIAEGAGLPLPRALLFMRLVDPRALAEALSHVLGKKLVDLDAVVLPPPPDVGVDEALCRELRVLPLAYEQGEGGPRLVLAMSDPSDQAAGVRVAAIVQKDVRPILVDDEALSRAIDRRFEADPTLPPKEPTLMLVDLASLELDVTTDPGGPVVEEPVDDASGVFADGDTERTVRTKRPAVARAQDTIRAPRPDLDAPDEPSKADASRNDAGKTTVSSMFKDLRVCLVADDRATRLRAQREIGPLLGALFPVESLERALLIAEEHAIDDVVVYDPKNDAPTGLLMDRLSRLCDDGIVVLSDDASFSLMPCVRVRLDAPKEERSLRAVVLDGLFSARR